MTADNPNVTSVDRTLLIESDAHRTRVAMLEDDRLVELFVERPEERGVVGNVYKGKVHRVLPGMQAAFVDVGLERDAFLYVGEALEPRTLEDSGVREGLPSIADVLRQGQSLVVQVIKDALPKKGARVSTQITLPGRYLVFLPGVPEIGISRRIEAPEERERLQALAESIQPEGSGLIIRTAAVGRDHADLAADLAVLEQRWRRIDARAREVRPPTLVHRDLDLAERVVRDELNDSFQVVRVAGEATHKRIRSFVAETEPALADRVRLDAYASGLFDRFGIDRAVDKALLPEVPLRSGGTLVINPTEALVAIDVNTGRYVGRDNLEQTVLATNLEAVVEVARQIRLRNLGGLVVVDLIDMEDEANREQVYQRLLEALAHDRSRSKALPISEFGLVELTRKRTRPSLERQMTRCCTHCHGTGRIRRRSAVCFALRQQLLARRDELTGQDVLVRVHPEVAGALQNAERAILDELETLLETEILVQSDRQLHQDRFEILGA